MKTRASLHFALLLSLVSGAAMAAPPGHAIDGSTVALWRFDEASGTTTTDAVGSVVLTAINGPTIVAGQVGNARSFLDNGTSQLMQGTASSAIRSTFLSSATVELLVKPAYSASGTDTIFDVAVYNSSGNDRRLLTAYINNSTGRLTVAWTIAANTFDGLTVTAATVTNNAYTHIGIVKTWSGVTNTYDIYFNGAFVQQFTAKTNPQSLGACDVVVGRVAVVNSDHFNGLVDEVRISNVARTSSEIAESYARTFTSVPAAPTIGTAVRGNGQADVPWTIADNGGSALTGHTVTSTPGGFTATAGAAATTATVTGLTNGTSYTFTVHATNLVGNSAESSASNAVTPATVSGAPTGVAATAGNAQAVVTWTAPASNGGSAVTGYVATSTPGSFTATVGAVLTGTVTGLTNGVAYTFTVHAVNAVGNSVESSASAAVSPKSPDSGELFRRFKIN